MKIVLTERELADLVRKTYSPPAEYKVANVEMRKYSSSGDFCTIEFEAEPAPEAIVHEGEEAALRR